MLKTLFRFKHKESWFAGKDERAFLDLLFAVLRELANPHAPADLAARIKRHSLSSHSTHPERKFIMKKLVSKHYALNSNQLMFTPLDQTGGRGMSRSTVGMAFAFNLVAIACLGITVRAHIVREGPTRLATVFFPATPPPPPPPVKLTVIPPMTPLKTETAPMETPKIARMEAPLPDPPPAPRTVVQPSAVPTVAPTAPVVKAAASAPAVKTVSMANSAIPVQPTGPAVTTVKFDSGSKSAASVGPVATDVRLGNPNGPTGWPGVAGIKEAKLGCDGCNGNNTVGNRPKVIVERPLRAQRGETIVEKPVALTPVHSAAPMVLSKPRPQYTAEAIAQHIEGTVQVRIRVGPDGSVAVLGISGGLGHGLDQSAKQCAQNIRFKPALDSNGTPTNWEGVVSITFQMS